MRNTAIGLYQELGYRFRLSGFKLSVPGEETFVKKMDLQLAVSSEAQTVGLVYESYKEKWYRR